jgi:serine/threonine-protein kinase ATR
MYRKVCEVSLKVIREYRESLITILKTFIYDPLVEWKQPANSKTNDEKSGETISAKGQIHLQNITSRLKGMHAKNWMSANQKIKALPLSVEGQVNSLIKVI